MFGVVIGVGEENLSIAVAIIILIIVALWSLGAAIIASVWGKEAIGGGLLIAAGVLYLGQTIYDILTYPDIRDLQLGWLEVAMILPPLVAGSLFLACHRRSKTSGEQPV